MPRTTAAALLAAALLLTGCGSTDDGEDAAEPEASGGVFPVTVEHKYGSTTVPAEPERVVSVGLTEQDVLLELGVVPVATTEWYGEQPYAVWPWAQDLLGDAKPEVLSTADGLEFERIAALDPDLIIGTNAGLTKRDYELLSAIAPTVTSVEGSTQYFSAWDDQVRQIATAVGKQEEGEALVTEVKDAYADVAAEHPEWQGKSATFSQGGPYDGELYVYPDGLNTEFLTYLGFEMTPGLEEYAADSGSQAQISGENVDLIDADLIVWATESQDMFDELMDFSTVADLGAVKGNRSVYTDDTLAGAIYFLTPLSLKFVLAELTEPITQAVNGEAPREFPA